MRAGLDWLRDELILVYENNGNDIFKDVWEARNDYINIILDPSDEVRIKFYFDHAKKILSEKELELSIDLLEMQKFSMLMYTSCGWFFSDISGIETLQILEYAKRAMELSYKITGIDPEPEFINRISEAVSNLSMYKDGRELYEKEIIEKRFEAIQNNY